MRISYLFIKTFSKALEVSTIVPKLIVPVSWISIIRRSLTSFVFARLMTVVRGIYSTDASTHEYESAQAMAISIDSIVRSIEDEKISEEERDKARDVWSRIDGINEKV